jgi:hypothetical protein
MTPVQREQLTDAELLEAGEYQLAAVTGHRRHDGISS